MFIGRVEGACGSMIERYDFDIVKHYLVISGVCVWEGEVNGIFWGGGE